MPHERSRPELERPAQTRSRATPASYGLDFFETVFEMLDYDELNMVAAYGGFPTRYPHWRFGMEYEQLSQGLRVRAVARSTSWSSTTTRATPTCSSRNAEVDQKLVMAHVYGHCDFFKNNFWFRHTNRQMIDEMANHATRVRRWIDKIGVEKVEDFIDRCLSLENLIDHHAPYIRRNPDPKRAEERGASATSASRASRSTASTCAATSTRRSSSRRSARRSRTRRQKAKQLPRAAAARRAAVPARARAARAVGARHPLDHPRGGLLLRAAGPDQDHERGLGHLLALHDHDHAGADGRTRSSTTPTTTPAPWARRPGALNPYKLGIELFRDIEERWNKGQFGKE